MHPYLKNKIMLVTGGSRGIGAAIVEQALAAGAKVVSCSRTGGMPDKPNDNHLHINIDISNTHQVDHLFEQTISHFQRLDIVINNAGTSQDSLLVHSTLLEWDTVMGVNLTAPFYISQQAIHCFEQQHSPGSILFVGSLAEHGAPTNATYATSKGGLVGLMRSIAAEYAALPIYANMVTLGFIETGMTQDYPDFAKRVLVESCPLKRAGTVEEVAASICFLAGLQKPMLNGQHIHVSGGLIDFPLDYPS